MPTIIINYSVGSLNFADFKNRITKLIRLNWLQPNNIEKINYNGQIK